MKHRVGAARVQSRFQLSGRRRLGTLNNQPIEEMPKVRRDYRHLPALLPMLCLPVAALAQTPAPCTAVAGPGAALAAWSAPVVRAAASDPAHLPGADIPVGQALQLALLPQGEVKFPLPPGKPGAAGSHAGLLGLTIAEPGTYRVALGTGAWIDLVDNARPVAATAHAHGPACSGIHKIVDFPLHPGGYVVQISANAEPQTTVLVVRVP